MSCYLNSPDLEKYSKDSKKNGWKGCQKVKSVWFKWRISRGSCQQGLRLVFWAAGGGAEPGLWTGTRSMVRGAEDPRGQNWNEHPGPGLGMRGSEDHWADGLGEWQWLCVVRVLANGPKLRWFSGKGRKWRSVIRAENFCVPSLLCKCQVFTF